MELFHALNPNPSILIPAFFPPSVLPLIPPLSSQSIPPFTHPISNPILSKLHTNPPTVRPRGWSTAIIGIIHARLALGTLNIRKPAAELARLHAHARAIGRNGASVGGLFGRVDAQGPVGGAGGQAAAAADGRGFAVFFAVLVVLCLGECE